MYLINGAWNAMGMWVTYKPLVGYSIVDGPCSLIEYWGCAAQITAVRRNQRTLRPG